MTTMTAQNPGPITADIRLTAGRVNVTVGNYDHAEVTVTGADEPGITETSGTLRIHPRNKPSTVGDATVIQAGRGVYVAGDNFGGVVVSGGGSIVIGSGNVQINRFGGTVSSVTVGSNISVDVHLPHGSSVVLDTTSADLEVSGDLASIRVGTVSGDVGLDGIQHLDAHTTSGDVTVRRWLGGHGTVRTVSGDIGVHAAGNGTITANSVSGDIRVTRDPGVDVEVDARSVSGRTRVN